MHDKLQLILLIAAHTINSMSMDIHLPALPLIAHDLNTSHFMVQMLIVIGIALTTVTPVFWGPMSDRYGRRPILVFSLALALAGQLGSCMAPNIEFLLLTRVIQYLGAGALLTIAMAIICDMYEGIARVKALAFVEMIVPCALLLAPLLGAYITTFFNWRYNFYISAFLLLIIFLGLLVVEKETAPKNNQGIKPNYFDNIIDFFSNKKFVLPSVLMSAFNAFYMVYTIFSSFYCIEYFFLTPTWYAVCQCIMVFFYIVGVFFYHQISDSFSTRKVLQYGMKAWFIYCCLAFLSTLNLYPDSVYSMVTLISIAALLAGPLIVACNALALDQANTELRGTASAVLEMINGLVSSIAMVVASLTVKSIVGFYISQFICASLALVIYGWYYFAVIKKNRKSIIT